MYSIINGQNIYYQKVGSGKDLILLHGWGQDVSSFWGVVEKLKGDFTLWLVDLPGFGRSDNPKKPFTVSDYSEIIVGFIKEHEIKKPNLLGHSLGGRVAIKLASKDGELIDKLILEDTAGLRPEKSLAQILAYPVAKLFKYLLPNAFNIKDRLRRKVYRSLESDYLQALDKDTFVNVIEEDLTEDLKRITSETLILWGEADRSVPLKSGKRIYRLIKDSRIEVFDDIGHFPHLENLDRFCYWVRSFLI